MKKRFISFVLALFMFVSVSATLTGCAMVQQVTTRIDEILNPVDLLVYGVREAIQHDYKVTYASAFDYYFTNSEWCSFTTDKGVEVVEFTGYCVFRDVYVHAKIQFTITPDGEYFEPTYLALNGTVQTEEMMYRLLSDCFEAYLRSGQ